jgi:hypothetical protein
MGGTHMNFKKSATIAATVAALGALSVPAFALENEFHGMYRLRAITSNYENAGGGTLGKDAPTLNVFEQRARLQYTAKASDDLKLVTHFEVDSSWGDTAYQNGRGMGGAQGADTVNLETKHVYLNFTCPLTGADVKAGIMPVADTYKGIIINDDAAGLLASKKMGALTATGGFFRLQDFKRTAPSSSLTVGEPTAPATTVAVPVATTETANPIGKQNLDLYILDAKLAVSKDLTLGGAYYWLRNDSDPKNVHNDLHVLGVNAAAKMGIITADAFFAYQTGEEVGTGGKDISAYAAQVAVKANLDKAGAIRANVLYTSGDKNTTDSKAKEWQSLNSGDAFKTSSNTYYDSKMVLMMRNVVNMDTDKAIVQTTSNAGRGLTLMTVGYDATITEKVGASANVGYARSSVRGTGDTDKWIGTEINAQVDYKMYSSLTASFTGAYVILGDAKKYTTAQDTFTNAASGTTKSDNPYLGSIMFNYTF